MILGLSPDLSACGFAAVRVTPDWARVVDTGVLRSRVSSTAVDVDEGRALTLLPLLRKLVDAYPFAAVCFGHLYHPATLNARERRGRARGMVDAVLDGRGLERIVVRRSEIKIAVGGRRGISAEGVLEALDTRTSGTFSPKVRRLSEALRLRAGAAAGAALAAVASHPELVEVPRQRSLTELEAAS